MSLRQPGARKPSARQPNSGVAGVSLLYPDVSATGSWTTSGSLPGITFGATMLGATFTKLDIEVQFAEAGGTIARAYAQYRPTTNPTAVRTTLDLWPVRPNTSQSGVIFYGSQFALYGCAFWCAAGTQYEVLVFVQDAAGTWARLYLGTVTTKVDAIPAASSLTPTRYVRTGGSDSATGLTAATAWASFSKAVASAPADAVVEIGPGFYGPASNRYIAGTFKAQFPAVNNGGKNGAEINVGNQAVIEPLCVTAPTGTPAWTTSISTNPYVVAPWVAVQVQGTGQTLAGGTFAAPTTPRWHGGDGVTPDGTLWRWAGVPPTMTNMNYQNVMQVGYSTTRTGHPKFVMTGDRDTAVAATIGGAMEIFYTNQDYTDGTAWQATNGDIYLKLPGNAPSSNPNDLWIKIGGEPNNSAINMAGSNIRVSGMAFHAIPWPLSVGAGGSIGNCIIDHNFSACANGPVRLGGSSGWTTQSISFYTHDHVVENNLFVHYNMWDRTYNANPWRIWKGKFLLENGLSYDTTNYPGSMNRWCFAESTGISARGGTVRTTVRRNRVVGHTNGWNPLGYADGENRYAGYGCEAYENYWAELADDVYELDYAGINQAIWNDTIRSALVFLSLGPHDNGPVYIMYCDVYDLTKDGIGKRNRPSSVTIDDDGLGCVVIKYSGDSRPRALCYMLHTTIWTDYHDVWGPAEVASAGTSEEGMFFRNNIWRVTGYTYRRAITQTPYTEDYNLAVTKHATLQAFWEPTNYATQAAWRTATGQGAHSNVIDGVTIDPTDYAAVDALLTDPATGDLRVTTAAQAKVVGVVLPGINDDLGRTPRIGYQP